MGKRLHELTYRPELFEVDGALRDVCVLSADLDDWHQLIKSLPQLESAGAEVAFAYTFQKPVGEGVPSASSIFGRLCSDPDESAYLAVRLGEVWFTSYFFKVDEIEFTFDPSDVSGEREFLHVKEFVEWMARVVRRPVIITMESTDHEGIPALYECLPSDVTA